MTNVPHRKPVIVFGNRLDLPPEFELEQATGTTVTTHAHGVEVAKSDMLDHLEEDGPWGLVSLGPLGEAAVGLRESANPATKSDHALNTEQIELQHALKTEQIEP